MTDTKAEADKFLVRQRTTHPAVYSMAKSGGRTTKQTQLLSTNEYNNAIGTNFTALNNRFDVKKEKFCDEISELRNRIVAYDCSGLDGLDDSDIEFLQNEIDNSDDDADNDESLPHVEVVAQQSADAEVADVQDETIGSENGNNIEADSTYESANETANETTNNNETNETEANQVQSSDEVDDLSGTISFVKNEFNDRYYAEYDVALRNAIVECLRAWNKSAPFSSVIYDKRFIGVLLKEVFRDELASKDLDVKQIVFIKRVFEIRVDNDAVRASKFDSIVAEKRYNAQSRCRANSLDDA